MIRKIFVLLGNLGVIAAFVLGIAILGSLRPDAERKEPEAPAPVVFVQDVTYTPVSLNVSAQGEVRPKQQIQLTTQVGGQIVMVSDRFADGGVIEKGDVLIKIEDADYRLAVTRARARVASAQQSLAVEKAESALAQEDYNELAGASGTAQPSDLTLRLPQLARAEADYQSALADLQDAKLGLARTSVRAPFDGRVRSIAANLGQFINPGTPIGEIFSTDVAEIRLPLTDEDLSRLNLPLAFFDKEQGPEVRLSTIAAGQMREWTGRIVRVDAAIDASTRQIAAIVEVVDPYGAAADNGFPLAIGLYVDADIAGPTVPNATVLPRLAVQPTENGYVAYTVNDEDVVVSNPITVAATTAQGFVVTDGLSEGDRVIISRLNSRVGSTVRALDPNAPSSVGAEPASSPSASAAGTSTTSNAGGR